MHAWSITISPIFLYSVLADAGVQDQDDEEDIFYCDHIFVYPHTIMGVNPPSAESAPLGLGCFCISAPAFLAFDAQGTVPGPWCVL